MGARHLAEMQTAAIFRYARAHDDFVVFSMLSRIVLISLIVLAGCSTPQSPRFQRQGGPAHVVSNACRVNPQSCMYDGQYEPGERQFAEAEARRLNQAQVERLRRLALP